MKEETREAFNRIMDLFLGADGGVRFCQFEEFLSEVDSRSDSDFAAQQAIDTLLAFDRLIQAATSSPE